MRDDEFGGGAGGSAFIMMLLSSVGILCSVRSLDMSVDFPLVDLPSSLLPLTADLFPVM